MASRLLEYERLTRTKRSKAARYALWLFENEGAEFAAFIPGHMVRSAYIREDNASQEGRVGVRFKPLRFKNI
jgi:hypothetical protein